MTTASPAGPPASQSGAWLPRLPVFAAWLPAAVVFASWLDWAPGGVEAVGRAGPYWAGLLYCIAMVVAFARRSTRVLLWAGTSDRGFRLCAAAAALVVIGWAVPAGWAADRRAALLGAARVLVTLLFVGTTYLLAQRSPRIRSSVAWVAVVLVVFQALLLGAGLASARVGALVFEQGRGHIQLGAIPRFRGLMLHPMACGSATLLLAGLVAGHPYRWLRAAAVAAALVVTAVTFSFATLVVPVALVLMLPVRHAVRAPLATLLAAAAVAAFWMNPLRLDIAGHTIVNRPLPPAYHLRDLGPKHMPIHTVGSGPWRLDFHWTGYALLAARSITCAAEHPVGVGTRNFEHRCRVMAMNTIGMWTDRRSAHNAYGALIAEGGFLATLATAVLVLLLARHFHCRSDSRVECAVIIANVLAGIGGASPYQFPFAALVALSIELKKSQT